MTIIEKINKTITPYICPKGSLVFDAENHFPCYNFCGPQTQVEKRLELIRTQGKSKPINQADAACMAHDISYKIIKDLKRTGNYSYDELNKLVREADLKMINTIKNIKNEPGILNKLSGALIGQIIVGKTLLEDMKVMNPQKYIGEGVRKTKIIKGTRKRKTLPPKKKNIKK